MCTTQQVSSPSLDDLARRVRETPAGEGYGPDQWEVSREEAAREVDRFLEQTARRILRRFGHPRSDLDSELKSFVWSRIKVWPEDRPFAAWSRKVMQNQFVDLLRKRSRSPLLPNPTDYADPYPMTFDESGLSQPFCDEDLQRIRRWKPLRRRIVVLCSYWLWRKVPQEEWTAWLEEAKAPTPFPPEEFEYLERAEMIPRLAAALGVSRNLLSVDCHRGRSWLLNLKYIQELRAA